MVNPVCGFGLFSDLCQNSQELPLASVPSQAADTSLLNNSNN